MGLIEQVKDLFGTSDLYQTLGVNKTAKDGELRRAYHKLSLKVHPDRVDSSEKDEATKKFQVLGKLYGILTDKEKRALYDEQGIVDDEDDIIAQDRNWEEYWRLLFNKITVDDIKAYEKHYKGSEQELEDLRSAYLEFEGDMDKILDTVLCSTIDDEPRFHDLIAGWIKSKEVPKFPAFEAETTKTRQKRKRAYEKEAREAAEAKSELNVSNDASLTALIQARQQSRAKEAESFLDSLEKKYAPKTKKLKGDNGASQSKAKARRKTKR
ncbi:dnaJ homolog subfamily C member 9-like [Dysidea avara]|uniref:dnaJ homolog subfamily C member 9-like n=1 Tax=Dysidea avara TaxID=196820 RepID=UPI003331FD15